MASHAIVQWSNLYEFCPWMAPNDAHIMKRYQYHEQSPISSYHDESIWVIHLMMLICNERICACMIYDCMFGNARVHCNLLQRWHHSRLFQAMFDIPISIISINIINDKRYEHYIQVVYLSKELKRFCSTHGRLKQTWSIDIFTKWLLSIPYMNMFQWFSRSSMYPYVCMQRIPWVLWNMMWRLLIMMMMMLQLMTLMAHFLFRH